jgi:hypothetical protein
MEDNTDIVFLLSVVHDITLSPEFVEKVIEKWRMYFPIPLLRQRKANDL